MFCSLNLVNVYSSIYYGRASVFAGLIIKDCFLTAKNNTKLYSLISSYYSCSKCLGMIIKEVGVNYSDVFFV